MPAKHPHEPLQRRRHERSADRAPQPFGGMAAGDALVRPRLFVVHKHAARRLHYDLRLEWNGVLLSWAVPRGPSTDPAQKRRAMEAGDHPVVCADFEGVIPRGDCGAGQAIVWDMGRWVPTEDPKASLASGKLRFELRGHKLRGLWRLFRTRGRTGSARKQWTLVKEADAWSGEAAGRSLTPESILSGLTVEELRSGPRRAHRIRQELRRLQAPARTVRAKDVTLMLAESAEAAFSGPGWLFELKYDGYRLLAGREEGAPRLLYRRGHDATPTFPEIVRVLKALPYDDLLLDGEVVVADAAGRPVFAELQQRALLRRRADVERAALERPATYYVFDLLGFEGFDLRPLPLLERKRLLRELLPRAGPLRFSDHVETRGEALYQEVRGRGLEGILAKRADSAYRGGRSPQWLKLRSDLSANLVIVGFATPKGSRVGFSGLHLADHVDGSLRYAGRVGSGFSEAELARTRATLEPLRRLGAACSGAVPKGRDNVWVEPRVVCEVRYLERTREGLLRQPVFLRFRDDKAPEECVREGDAPKPPRRGEAAEGQAKGDLIGFYRDVSPWLLPYLRDRPLVPTRHPDGVGGRSFFQKDAPSFVPGWVRTERIWSEHARREIDCFVCDDVETLLYVVNMGGIPLHIWSSRVATLARPDWCVLDLDPGGAPFEDVVTLARAIHALSDEIGVPSFPKTSGASGLHVLIPLGRQLSYEQSRSLGELLARVICEDHPEIATTVRAVGNRGGRVYVDYLQNGHGRLLVSPFSVRPLPGAPVSTTLLWKEVEKGLDPMAFTIRTVVPRLERLEEDPLRPVLQASPDLSAALEHLAARLSPRRKP